MKFASTLFASALLLSAAVPALAEEVHDHYDIAPYLVEGNLLTGGLDHEGNAYGPTITVYGYEFGEDPDDPYNAIDPGISQAAGLGNLPAGAAVSYNILSSLLYWDGAGDVGFDAPTEAYIDLLVGSQSRTIDGDSGAQAGAFIQTVASSGDPLHKHFVTSLYAAPGAGNIPGIGDPGYVAPPTGIYAFGMELVLNDGGTAYTSNPFWLVFNNGLDEHAHHEAMEALVPEPATMLMVPGLILGLCRRRR